MRRPATASRETIWFLALFVGYPAAVGVLDLVSGSTLLAELGLILLDRKVDRG